MPNEPRITPLDPDTAEGELKETLEAQKKLWGQPLTPYLLYGRSPATFKGAIAMWTAVRSFKKIDARLKTLVNRRVAWWNGCPF